MKGHGLHLWFTFSSTTFRCRPLTGSESEALFFVLFFCCFCFGLFFDVFVLTSQKVFDTSQNYAEHRASCQISSVPPDQAYTEICCQADGHIYSLGHEIP